MNNLSLRLFLAAITTFAIFAITGSAFAAVTAIASVFATAGVFLAAITAFAIFAITGSAFATVTAAATGFGTTLIQRTETSFLLFAIFFATCLGLFGTIYQVAIAKTFFLHGAFGFWAVA
ncbi:MAG: hypothetical protein FWH27_08590 [Planctomycetaceae bacterium]|nr:hypothetical protein [Planctomycetaceae bacterium]